MGNFYQMIAQMEDGDMIRSASSGLTIKKDEGVLKYVENGEVATHLGKDGFVITLDNMNCYVWEKIENFIYEEVTDLNEIRTMLKNGETLYIDDSKTEIEKYDAVRRHGIEDFEEAFVLTTYYKKVVR